MDQFTEIRAWIEEARPAVDDLQDLRAREPRIRASIQRHRRTAANATSRLRQQRETLQADLAKVREGLERCDDLLTGAAPLEHAVRRRLDDVVTRIVMGQHRVAAEELALAAQRGLAGRRRPAGRDERLTLLRSSDAARLARDFVAEIGQRAEQSLADAVVDAEADIAAVVSWLSEFEARLQRLHLDHPQSLGQAVPPVLGGAMPGSVEWPPGPASTLAEAAEHSVQPLSARRGWRLWPLSPHSYRRDLPTVCGLSGYLVERKTLLARVLDSWHGWLASYETATRSHLREVVLKAFATRLDGHRRTLKEWTALLAAAESEARSRLSRAARETAAWERLPSDLDHLDRVWSDVHRPDRHGLSQVTRAALPALAEAATPWLGPAHVTDLLRLSGGRRVEVRIPVLAPMNAGKSTLLCALLGHEVLPRRAQAMTVLATRLVTGGPAVSTPLLRLEPELLEQVDDLADRLRTRLTGGAPAELRGHPHLARLAGALMAGGPVLRNETSGAEAVERCLFWLNDFARLAILLLPELHTRRLVDWLPEVRVPGEGHLVFVDTPGRNETIGTSLLDDIALKHLATAHACLVLLDYTQLGSTSEAAFAERIRPALDVLDDTLVWLVVNRIDRRRDSADLDQESTAAAARRLFGRDGVAVFETSGLLAGTGLRTRERSGIEPLHRAVTCRHPHRTVLRAALARIGASPPARLRPSLADLVWSMERTTSVSDQ